MPRVNYIPAMTDEEETVLRDEFIKDHPDSFFEFIKELDGTILWDFVESMRWAWKQYKEDNRGNQ